MPARDGANAGYSRLKRWTQPKILYSATKTSPRALNATPCGAVANRALLASERAYVIRHGQIELDGRTQDLRSDPAFDRAYFGFDTSEGIATH